MNYKFPKIKHIDEILPHIEGKDEFFVSEKENFKIVNYTHQNTDTFPPIQTESDAILRELRGLVFDNDGNILSRRFHKFFNVGEKEETRLENIDLSKKHWIIEKIDGSMISMIYLGKYENNYPDLKVYHNIRWITKMGHSSVALEAESFVAGKKNFSDFALFCYYKNITPIFEYCSTTNPIVVKHDVERMVLLAMRDIHTGKYVEYDSMVEHAKIFDLEYVKRYRGTVKNMEKLCENIRKETEGEGWVIRFEDGHMIKIKNDQYVRLHRVLSYFHDDFKKTQLVIEDNYDDLIGILDEEKKEEFLNFVSNFWMKTHNLQVLAERELPWAIDRKSFSLGYNENPIVKYLVFKLLDETDKNNVRYDPSKPISGHVLDFVKRQCQTPTRFETYKRYVLDL